MLNPVPILVYHSVCDDPPGWIAPFAVSPALFAGHLDVVAASGRQALTVSQYTDGLRGRIPLPPRPVLITVDDGFADFAGSALPLLAERGLPSTLYVTTGALGDRRSRGGAIPDGGHPNGAHPRGAHPEGIHPDGAFSPGGSVLPPADMLRAADLPGLAEAGVEIGAHSHTHRQLDLLPRREAAAELTRSRDLLARMLGHPVRSFAYPHGYWRAQVRRLVGEAGFDSACAVGDALSSGHDHPLALSRLMVRAGTSPATVAGWLAGTGASAARPGRRVLAFGWRQCRRLRAGRQEAALS